MFFDSVANVLKIFCFSISGSIFVHRITDGTVNYGVLFMCIDISLLLISGVDVAVCSECQIRWFPYLGCLSACYSACLESLVLLPVSKCLTGCVLWRADFSSCRMGIFLLPFPYYGRGKFLKTCNLFSVMVQGLFPVSCSYGDICSVCKILCLGSGIGCFYMMVAAVDNFVY